jgi:hypothetical protein
MKKEKNIMKNENVIIKISSFCSKNHCHATSENKKTNIKFIAWIGYEKIVYLK